ncbi:uncharacterized protein BDR25DRAFT_107228 [Lindgomyces ingoldianus]|uniref:Uncharacterized protein n=1 Tax=Lindgomyces ingoldianus TaxID=673940 RepID=A0ACB6QB58_9PLEO|nr:uncharacterized protein BDR25DRAFT_107228 [Lindgomyces ingoldianus]KAF2463617.1 hypothetical protein BDR25DRAFT_107228 [Lindgomyces ingoldianus]
MPLSGFIPHSDPLSCLRRYTTKIVNSYSYISYYLKKKHRINISSNKSFLLNFLYTLLNP